MVMIDEEVMGEVAGNLIRIAGGEPRGILSFSSIRGDENLPSIGQVYNAFKNLPEGHELKRQYDLTSVQKGFKKMNGLGLRSTNPYACLDRMLNPTLI